MNKKILAFIYNKESDAWLLLKTSGEDPSVHGPSKWYTVTGSVEKNETMEEAVKREVLEETGLKVNKAYSLKRGCRYSWQGNIYDEEYYIAYVSNTQVTLDGIEMIDYLWLPLKEYLRKLDWKEDKQELKSLIALGLLHKLNQKWVNLEDYTSNKPIRSIFIENEKETILSWHESDNFEKLSNVRQCYGICFDNEGKILIIKNDFIWSIPGGTPENNEAYEETLKRELMEEANVEIESIYPIGYNAINFETNEKKTYFNQLRYIASISRIHAQKVDPATKKKYLRKFIDPKKFSRYVLWGITGEAMIKRALEIKEKYAS